MSPLSRSLGLALACAHLVVATAPCGDATGGPTVASPASVQDHGVHGQGDHAGHAMPSEPSEPAAHTSHASHGMHGHDAAPSSPRHDDESLGWKAPCPCGCDRAPGKDAPGHRLDPGLLLARAVAGGSLDATPPEPPAPTAPVVFLDGPDGIPQFA